MFLGLVPFELLRSLVSRPFSWPGSLADQIFVQEWVDFEVEMRHFLVEVDLNAPWQ